MRIISKPAIRDGWPKKLFHQPLVRENVERGSDGVAITLIVKDIYTKGANQRYTIKLTADDLAMLISAEN